MSTEVATNATTRQDVAVQKQASVKTVRKLLEDSRSQIEAALPRTISADQMIRVVLTSVQQTPTLLDCDQRSLMGAVIQAAQLGLVPDGIMGHAYLVPYKNRQKNNRLEAQLIPGYKGLMTLARRSGEISAIRAELVYEKDFFEYELGLTQKLVHRPQLRAMRGAVICVYAIVELRDGGKQFVVMDEADINRIKARSASVRSGRSSPWDTDPGWMWKKTAIKQVLKLAPASLELQRAIALDERDEIGLPQDLGLLSDPDGAHGETATPIDAQTLEATVVEDELTPQSATAADVMRAAQAVGLDAAQLRDFVMQRTKKLVVGLKPGQECYDIVVELRKRLAVNLSQDIGAAVAASNGAPEK